MSQPAFAYIDVQPSNIPCAESLGYLDQQASFVVIHRDRSNENEVLVDVTVINKPDYSVQNAIGQMFSVHYQDLIRDHSSLFVKDALHGILLEERDVVYFTRHRSMINVISNHHKGEKYTDYVNCYNFDSFYHKFGEDKKYVCAEENHFYLSLLNRERPVPDHIFPSTPSYDMSIEEEEQMYLDRITKRRMEDEQFKNRFT